MRLRILLIGLIVGVFGFMQFRPGQPEMSILFAGNSYTATEGIPWIVQEIAAANGTPIEVTMVAPGGYTLEDHTTDSTTMETIRTGEFDIVVIQEQSLYPADSQLYASSTSPAATQLSATVKGSGARLVLYQTWARRDGTTELGLSRQAMHERLVESYDKLGRTLSSPVAPAGENRLRASEAGFGDALFASDGSHPSLVGAYLSAATLARTILGEPLAAAPPVGVSDTAAS